MGKKSDKLILDLLKEKVLERDKELERMEYHSATKEALAELTSLSQAEVDNIYKSVKAQVESKRRKRRNRILFFLTIIAVLALIAVFIAHRSLRESSSFTEDFADNSNLWSFQDKAEGRRYLIDGEFVMEAEKEETYLDYIDHEVDLPKNYSIELDTRRISGIKDSYGLYLGEDANNFGYFFIRSNGKFRPGFSVGGKWQDNPGWAKHETINSGDEVKNKLKVVVADNQYTLYINGTNVGEGKMHNLKCSQYSIATGGKQKVAYDNLLILNTDTKDTVYANTFDQPDTPWVANENIKCKAEFKNDNYYIRVNEKDNLCYWAQTWMPDAFLADIDLDIQIKARIEQREGDAVMGFMWLRNDNDYLAFEVKNGTAARVSIHKGDEYKYVGRYSPKIENIDGSINLRIVKSGNTIEYYFNEQLIDRIKQDYWLYFDDLERIALRVCNNQTVVFEHLQITEIQ